MLACALVCMLPADMGHMLPNDCWHIVKAVQCNRTLRSIDVQRLQALQQTAIGVHHNRCQGFGAAAREG